MTYHLDGLTIKSRLFKTEEMSLIAKIWCCITILALFAVLSAVIDMPIRALVGAITTLAVITWMNWIY